MSTTDAKWIVKEFLFDLNFYGVVEFNEKLISGCIHVIRKCQMKVLDGIQLSSAIIAKPDVFIVSDKQLLSRKRTFTGEACGVEGWILVGVILHLPGSVPGVLRNEKKAVFYFYATQFIASYYHYITDYKYQLSGKQNL